jgi:osmoprotectant transport system ATP-binding protein
VTHDIDEAVKLGDRIAVMRQGGQLVQFATPERVLAAPADPFVERFLGVDRGVRWLSFFPSSAVALQPAVTVEPSASADEVREEATGAGGDWILVVGGRREPLGWRQASDATGALRPIGHSFCPATDSMRAALDAVVLSPAGLAVAVDEAGSVLGVASSDEINKAISGAEGRS